MKELEFINFIAKRFKAQPPVVKGIGDDCAVLKYTASRYMLLTSDMIAEGTHFTKKATPFQIGWKAMAVNISDIASMGGIPKYALLSIGVSRKKNTGFLKKIIKGVEKASKRFGITVIGGDTISSRKTVLNVTMTGEVEKKRLVTRKGARPGDLLFVTGALGEKGKDLDFLPRVREARTLVQNFKINSMIDLSDGLAMDLGALVRASAVGACVHESLIPLSERSLPLKEAICRGEDFELLFTASLPESKRLIKRMGEKEDLPISLIGEIVKKPGVFIIGETGKVIPLKPKGFRHL